MIPLQEHKEDESMQLQGTPRMTAYRDEMVEALSALIAFPSVKGPAIPGAPYGAETVQALELVLGWGRAVGCRTCNLDGKAGWLEFGEGPKLVAALCHLDVVPAGSGWSGDPFTMRLEGGRLIGRGVVDDKGPAIMTFFALKALAADGLPKGIRFRLVLGLDEESGSGCMERYLETEEVPNYGFTPDADFPVIHAEKGIAMFRLDFSRSQGSGELRLVAAEGGSRPNMVPGTCRLTFACEASRRTEWVAQARNLPAILYGWKGAVPTPFPFIIEENAEEDRFTVVVTGRMAHASLPWDGRNAVSAGMFLAKELLDRAGVEDAFVAFYTTRIGMELDGRSLGCASEDDVSGPLTLNVGILALNDSQAKLTFDIRYPVTLAGEVVESAVRAAAEESGARMARVSGHVPLFVPKTDPLVTTLMGVYERATGTKSTPVSIGGGTYARSMPNIVAFGPGFPGMPQVAHQADESIAVDDLLAGAEVYLAAFEELGKVAGG
jgi:succinyl-diaminopimelate desuccinylase